MEYKYAMLFALLFIAPVTALGPLGNPLPGDLGEIKAEALDAAMDDVKCKADFTVGVLESVMDHVNGTGDLQGDVDTLNTDVSTLQNHADNEDAPNFRIYLRDSFAPHMREARQDILDARINLTPVVKAALKTDYDSLKSEYQSCNEKSLERFANAKVNAYEGALELAEDRAANLSAKGINTSGLTSLISEAREEIVEPLKDALEDAQNGTDVVDAIKQYCLFNGCKNGLNFHFWGKFDAEKQEKILAYIKDDAEDAGLGDDVARAQADIDSAQAAIDAAGTTQYSEGTGQEILEDLRSAAQKIKDILRELRSS